MATVQPLIMWGFQDHFFLGIESAAKSLFNALDGGLKPKVFLVGFPLELADGVPVACVWPANCGHDPLSFAGVGHLAKQFRDADESFCFSMSDYVNHRVEDERVRSCIANALQHTIAKLPEAANVVTYCSVPQPVASAFAVSVVLQLSREAVESFHTVHNNRSPSSGLTCPRSFVAAVVGTFLRECERALRQREPGSHIEKLVPDPPELLRQAGQSVMNAAVFAGGNNDGLNHLFDWCNAISLERYEGATVTGRLIFIAPTCAALRKDVSLTRPVAIFQAGAVRKLLEICSKDQSLLANGSAVYALGNVNGSSESSRESSITVDFTGHYEWRLSQAGNLLMEVKYGQPRVPPEKLSKAKFATLYRRIFPEASLAGVDHIWSLVESAMAQRHGTTLVIVRNAEDEAVRLGDQSTPVSPFKITPDLVNAVTRIDGAVMVDPEGTCTAIGVILDGDATSKGDPGRGARYNSAVRYVEKHPTARLAVVVSTDGTVNLLPHLKPQIDRSLLTALLDELRAMTASESIIDERRYSALMDELNAHEFYLSEGMCAEVNATWPKISNKLQQQQPDAAIPLFPPFKSNDEMDDSYFISVAP